MPAARRPNLAPGSSELIRLRDRIRKYRRIAVKYAGRGATSVYRLLRRAGLEQPYQLVIRTYRPNPTQWPAELRLSVAAIADIHFGEPYLGLDRLQMIIDTTNATRPDLIVLLGDYGATHHHAIEHRQQMTTLARAASRLSAPLGVFAVLGNHDWSADPAALIRGAGPVVGEALVSAGIQVLENDAVRLEHHGRPFWLAGLGDQLARVRGGRGVDDLPGTISKMTDDAPAILLAHEPDVFPAVPSRFALTLAGHTHGGQIRVFGYPLYVPSRYGRRYVHGHVIEDDRHLVVAAGVGATDLPIRIGVPPEIALVQLGGTARC